MFTPFHNSTSERTATTDPRNALARRAVRRSFCIGDDLLDNGVADCGACGPGAVMMTLMMVIGLTVLRQWRPVRGRRRAM